MKKRTILLFSIIPLLIGFFTAKFGATPKSTKPTIINSAIADVDSINVSLNGDVYQINRHIAIQKTHGQTLMSPQSLGDNGIAVDKKLNFSSLVEFFSSGKPMKTLFSGDTGNIDTMSWATDPSVSSDQKNVAYVSDKDRLQTGIPDNALYVYHLNDGTSTNVVQPDAYSGGIAHPVFDPTNANRLLFDFYKYNPVTFVPYSLIELFHKDTGVVDILTKEEQNAYQAAVSPDGKQVLFLGRNGDTNTVILYIADFDGHALKNTQTLAVGDMAYPTFSNEKGRIYFLSAEGNSGYNLVTTVVKDNGLTDKKIVIGGFSLLGTSLFNVVKD